MVNAIGFLVEELDAYRSLDEVLAKWRLQKCPFTQMDELWRALDADDSLLPDIFVIEIAGHTEGALESCRRLLAQRPTARVILVLDQPHFDTAVQALRAGAFDILTHPVDPQVFEQALSRAMRAQTVHEQVQRLRQALSEATGFEMLIGVSRSMQQLYRLLERAATAQASVLITGESGTGKELVASALHRRSARRDRPFVAVNCSAIPDALIESELFGHVKGAFTDARVGRPGLFMQASGGTLFLDEIGDMPMSVQPKLLRALQERRVRPVGGDTEVAIDVRVMTATNINLEQAVAERAFRQDLYYRINVIHIEMPPLRERASDVLLIAQHFIEHYALHLDKSVIGLTPEVADKLLAYDWPGNIRELQNCIERAVSLTQHDQVQVDDLPDKISNHRPSHLVVVGTDPADLVSMTEIERRYIVRVLDAVGGNKRAAARVLGFDRKTLYRKLERYAITPRCVSE